MFKVYSKSPDETYIYEGYKNSLEDNTSNTTLR